MCAMEIVHTMASKASAERPRRRYYNSQELKTQVVAECQAYNASVAGVALAHGINANTVHRWLQRYARGGLPAGTPSEPAVTPAAPMLALDPNNRDQTLGFNQATHFEVSTGNAITVERVSLCEPLLRRSCLQFPLPDRP